MRKKIAVLISVCVLVPFVTIAQSSDDVILNLLSSLDGPVSSAYVAPATPASTPAAVQKTAPVQTTPSAAVLTPFHLFSLDSNDQKPDPNIEALKLALQALTVQFAALSASTTAVTATTQATGTAEVAPPVEKQFTRNLGVGSRGEDVTQLQIFLIARGLLFGEPTGYYGILTKTAVTTFQADQGLSQVGTVGPKTREILNALPSERMSTIAPPPQSLGPVSLPFIASSTSVSFTMASSTGTTTPETASSTPMFDTWAPPVSVSMSILPSVAPIGGSVAVTWLSQNATSCVASDGWEGTKATLGAATIQPLQFSLNFVITCTGPGGIASTSALVVVGGEQ